MNIDRFFLWLPTTRLMKQRPPPPPFSRKVGLNLRPSMLSFYGFKFKQRCFFNFGSSRPIYIGLCSLCNVKDIDQYLLTKDTSDMGFPLVTGDMVISYNRHVTWGPPINTPTSRCYLPTYLYTSVLDFIYIRRPVESPA